MTHQQKSDKDDKQHVCEYAHDCIPHAHRLDFYRHLGIRVGASEALFTVIVGMFRGEMMVRGRNYRARKSNTGQSKQTNKQIHARTHAPTHTSPSCLCSCSQCLHVWMGGCRGDGASAAPGTTTTRPPCWFVTRDLCTHSRLLNEVVRGYRCLYIYLHGGERR